MLLLLGGKEREARAFLAVLTCYLHTASLPAVLRSSLSKLFVQFPYAVRCVWDACHTRPPGTQAAADFSSAVLAARPWRNGHSLCHSFLLHNME